MTTATTDCEANSAAIPRRVTRALISVSDKTGLSEFAGQLVQSGIEIFSTGGTRRHLEEAGYSVKDVSAYTGFPEMMDGRVKTLHPKIFAGILARRDQSTDLQALANHEIQEFDLIVVNLYPFRATIEKPGVTLGEAVEQIDIGGPSLVRAAAKNHRFVAIVTNPEQYSEVVEQINDHGGTDLGLRKKLMAAAFQHTAEYDRTIADFFTEQFEGDEKGHGELLPTEMRPRWQKQVELRYGENQHQRAAVYNDPAAMVKGVFEAEQLNGKQLSYNNLLDLDAAWRMVTSLPQPACSVIKHNNPCGAAVAEKLETATRNAFAGDPVSAFGSVIAMNRQIDEATANWMAEGELFVEAIVAPGFSPQALEVLTSRPKWKKNVRLLAMGDIENPVAGLEVRPILGGTLVQEADNQLDATSDWKVVTELKPDGNLYSELAFGWAMVRHVKSNAITLSRDGALVGVGAGQMSRVDAVNISIEKAGERSKGSVLASDAFFPFPDSIELAAKAGIAAIIQPGGSVKDEDVIATCNQFNIPMVFTGKRHFRH